MIENRNIDEIIVLCGGKGTRIASLYSDLPKPMIPINKKPFLEILVNNLVDMGFKKIVLSAGYMGTYILDYFSKKNYDNVEIIVNIEQELLGTGGAVVGCLKYINKEIFFVINGDTYIDFNKENLIDYYLKNGANGVLLISKVDSDSDYGFVGCDKFGKLTSFERNIKEKGYAFSGVYLLKKNIFKVGKEKFNLDEFIKNQDNIYVYKTENSFFDIGTPRRLEKFLKVGGK